MVKRFFKIRGKLFILLVVLSQLLNTTCARKTYPEQSFRNLENQDDEKKLQEFLNAGTEKEINSHKTNAKEIIETAKSYLGVPHCMGGTTKKCMDCSGLLVTVFSRHGIQLPHNSEEQARFGKIITETEKLTKGDLIFFIKSYKTHRFITHSGIYIGDNKFIHTSSTKGVTITSLSDPWWNDKFIFGTRVIE